MFRDLRLAETEAMNHVADGARPIAQQLDDLKAVGFGQGLQGFHHGESEYALIRIFLSRYIPSRRYTRPRVCFEHNWPFVLFGIVAQYRKLRPDGDFFGGLDSCAQLLFFSRPLC